MKIIFKNNHVIVDNDGFTHYIVNEDLTHIEKICQKLSCPYIKSKIMASNWMTLSNLLL